MSCDIYTVWGWNTDEGKWEEKRILFSEMDDSYRCLCTFPGNDKIEGIDKDRIISLALLGAAVAMAHHGRFDDEYIRLPYDIPGWIREAIGVVANDES